MKIEEYAGKYNELTRALLLKFMDDKKGENLALSPMSIMLLLGIAADATAGVSRDEIMRVLGTNLSNDACMDVMKELQMAASESASLVSSNAVCVKNSISGSIKEEYKKHLKEWVDGEVFSSEHIVRDVNAWVSDKTRGMIPNAADDSMERMLAFLMNAVAFEAEWIDQYEEDDIYEGNFHNADGATSKVQMLESSEHDYIEDEFFTGFLKSYKDKKYALMALLPKKKKSGSFLRRAVKQIDFTALLNDAVPGKVIVTMPEFKYDFGEDLTGFCREFGIESIFTPQADFSPMSDEWLKMDSIIHKAHIEIDRKGTKAAAVTIGCVMAGCLPDFDDIKFVHLDRPFVYAIMDTETKLPVFVGLYNQAG